MSPDHYKKLSWLPKPPVDFGARCRELASSGVQLGKRIGSLATHALDEHQLGRLGRILEKSIADRQSLAPLTPFRLALTGNGTLDLIAPALVASAARHGIALECVRGAYDQFLQDSFLPDSVINCAKPDAVLLVLDHRGLPLRPTPGNAAAATQTVDAALDLVNNIRSAIRANSKAPCILQTVAPPPESLFGSLDRALPGTARQLAEQFNRRLAAEIFGSEDMLLDVAALAETVGLADWHSPALWNMAKLPFSDGCVALYAEHVARLIAAMRGKSRRCLVLDLDNTLWGGVIGDDGLEGIKLAQGDATGEAHLSVQNLALALRERGVVLAVSSKNTDNVARQPFREHPEMRLKESHIAVFQANWNDKASNIRAIAEALSLGLESLVFLDDNPAERDLVRRELPQVAVPELDDDPANFARILSAAGYFEATSFTAEDRIRAQMYQDNARRLTLQQQSGGIDAYLRSLEMRIVFGGFTRTTRSRVSQLINKSNQFNLTTRRYTEADVGDVETDPAAFGLQARLIDKFGDNGIISVVVCRPDGAATWAIDSWLMSCRVLGRQVETMMLREILLNARHRGVAEIIGVYRPTERNGMVRDHYAKLGFTLEAEDPDGTTWWRLSTQTDIDAAPMEVERCEAELLPA